MSIPQVETSIQSQVATGAEPAGVGDSLAWYLHAVAGTPRLGAEAEAALAERVAAGSAEARAQMIEANLRLVVAVARSYCVEGGPRLLELIQEGNLGLIEAVDRYDPSRGNRFASYAGWCIRGRILEVLDGDWHLRARRSVHEARRAVGRLRTALGREPTWDEVGLELERPPMQVQELLASSPTPVSLDAGVTADGDASLIDGVEDAVTPGPLEQVEDHQMRRELSRAMDHVNPRCREVLELRYGLVDGSPRTLDEVGVRLHVSRERVRQLEARGMAQLRREGKGLRGYVN
jgi:RNA polymerase primary sigma factor